MDKKFKIFVIIAIAVLGITIAAVSTFVVLNMAANKGTETEAVTDDKKNSKTKLVIIDLGDAITSNVYDEIGDQHIARVTISFGANQASKQYKKFSENFGTQNVVIRDQIISSIREQTYEMMSKSDAQAKLGDEIIIRINELLDTDVIEAVYFSDFFVQ